MSKTITKVIAALGIVAGLGVAVLPLASYAATPNVIISVTVGDTGAGTPDCSGTSCDIPGTNWPTGQTITFADSDGGTFSLAHTGDVPSNLGSSTTTGTRVIPTIGSPIATIPANGGYGVKTTTTGDGASGYVVSPAAIESSYESAPSVNASMWHPVSNSISTYTSNAAVGDVNIAVTHDARYAANTETGTYTNTVSFTTATNP